MWRESGGASPNISRERPRRPFDSMSICSTGPAGLARRVGTFSPSLGVCPLAGDVSGPRNGGTVGVGRQAGQVHVRVNHPAVRGDGVDLAVRREQSFPGR